jgi:GNAT superfamily N-acetyltransferase
MSPIEVRAVEPGDADACVRVLAALPTHFTLDTHDAAAAAVRSGAAWIARVDDRAIGFVALEHRFTHGAEITYAAVLPEHQGAGIGAALVAEAVRHARDAGVRAVEVKTLDASAGYEPYVATRAFWEARGFVQVDRIDPLPGWQPGNPCAIYVLPLA